MAISCFGMKSKLVLSQKGPLSRLAESFGLIVPVRMFSSGSSGSSVGSVQTRSQNCSSPTSPQSCIIVGEHENIVIDGTRFESLSDCVSRLSPVSRIPPGGLITVSPAMQLQTNDDCRFLLWTAFLNSLFAKKRRLFFVNPYDDNNIGVIKDLGMLAFKELVPAADAGQGAPYHSQYIEFVKRFLCKLHGPLSLRHLRDWDSFVQSAPTLTDEQMLYHSVFFQDEDAAILFFDVHRFAREQFFARGLSIQAERILMSINGVYNDLSVVKACNGHFLLKNLLGVHEPASRALRLLFRPHHFHRRHPRGSAVVDAHRIAVTHSIEYALLNKICLEFPNIDRHLLSSYVRKDVVRLLRYTFPLYIQASLDAFRSEKKLWDELDMRHRLPIPSVFYYSSPKEEVAVPDRAVGSTLST